MLIDAHAPWTIALTTLIMFMFAAAVTAKEKGPTRYVRFQSGETIAYGILEDDHVRQIDGDPFGAWHPTDTLHRLEDVQVLVPSQPTKVLALAGNYKDHLGDKPLPETPEPFYKVPSCLLAHEGAIVQPSNHEPVHYEAELVVVIGRRARDVPEAKALEYVLGVTCGNDISARYWQRNDVQWWRAKGSDTFGPCGPFVASNIDFGNLDIQLRVNGEVKQKTNTRNMIFDIPRIVSFISHHVTLEPGDLIFTGTPGQTEPMNPGDVVEVEIEGVGILKNYLVSE